MASSFEGEYLGVLRDIESASVEASCAPRFVGRLL